MRETWKRERGDTDNLLMVCVEDVTHAIDGSELEVGNGNTAMELRLL